MYVYRPNAALNGTQITLRIGDKINDQVGYDFQKCLAHKGDYFGNSTADMNNDLVYSGYDDNDCYVNVTPNSITLYFSRYLNTHDDFDNVIGKTTNFCFIVGPSWDCHQISPKITFPQMSV